MMQTLPTLQEGWQLLQRGDHAQADQIACKLLEFDGNNAEAWLLRGVSHQFAGQFPTAQQAYEQSLSLKPDFAEPMNNLGVLLAATGRHEEAFALRSKYLKLRPNDAIANCNYALSLCQFGRRDEAIQYFRRALAINPEFLDALAALGALLVQNQNHAEAIQVLQRALELRPKSVEIANNLGLANLSLGQFDSAETYLRQALQLSPKNYEALTNLGSLYARTDRLEAGFSYLRQALQIRPDGAIALDNCGNVLCDLRRHEEAVACFEKAVAVEPNSHAIRNNFGKALAELCRFDDAQVQLREAIRLRPDHAEAHNLLGLVLYHVGDDAGAEACFAETIRLSPQHNRARMNRSFIWLRRGEFTRAWSDYELRFALNDVRTIGETIPRWDGGNLNGRSLLVRCEQGLGDVIQFLRFMPVAKAKGGRTIVELPKSLMPIASRCPGVDEFVTTAGPLPHADVQIPLLSLPAVLNTIEAPEPHMFADPKLVDEWADRLRAVDGFRVGVAWQGDATFRFDRARSIPLSEYEPLARVPGVRLVSLQKHAGLDQIVKNATRVPLVFFGDDFDEQHGAFMDTAAIIRNLDLVITSDSAIAHLAGGLGVPVWLAVQYAPDWRWFLDRDDSPWYPTMKLFRQKNVGAWTEVFQRMAAALRDLVSSRSRPTVDAAAANAWLVPTSPGELLDKISILRIKSERLANPAQLANVKMELAALEQHRERLLKGHAGIDEFLAQLHEVNSTLWRVEDELRQCEIDKRFDDHFIELARSVYKTNDRRAAIKKTINTQLGSKFVEEKTHELPEVWPTSPADSFQQLPRS